MTRESFELWMEDNPRLTAVFLTLFILAGMGLAGWCDQPITGY